MAEAADHWGKKSPSHVHKKIEPPAPEWTPRGSCSPQNSLSFADIGFPRKVNRIPGRAYKDGTPAACEPHTPGLGSQPSEPEPYSRWLRRRDTWRAGHPNLDSQCWQCVELIMNVRIYDYSTKTLTEIPATELAPGYVRVRIIGIDGKVFVKADEINMSSEYAHPPFDDQTRAVFASFCETFVDIWPHTIEEWEHGFRMDQYPEQEIEVWKKIEAAYKHFTDQKKVPIDAKRDYFNIALSFVNNGYAAALEVIELRRLSKARARNVVRELQKMFPR